MFKIIKFKVSSIIIALALCVPAKADVIGAPILVVQAFASIITFFASHEEYRPSKLLSVENQYINIDSQAFKKKNLIIEKYLFYQCQNWNEKKVVAQSELNIINKSRMELFKIGDAQTTLDTKLKTAILLFAINDFSNTHIRKSSFGGSFKKRQWSEAEFKYQLKHKGCNNFDDYQKVKAWSKAKGFPFFL